ncbi:MAG: tyrosine--tRNA ligase, partial [Candidatus Bathyarchaeia archaeon]
QKFGGDICFSSYKEVEEAYLKGELHAQDLKMAVANYLDEIVAPFREHFCKTEYARLLEVYKEVRVTR